MRTKRGLCAVALAAALVSAGAAACSKPSDDDASGDTVPVGVTVEKTGPVPVLGLAERGVRAAADDLNKRGGIGGRKVELMVRDNAGDPGRAIENIREFENKGVKFVVGPVFGQDCTAVAPELARTGMVGLCISPNDLPDNPTHMFGIGVGYTPTVEYEITWMSQQGKKAGILATKDESSDETIELASGYGERHGLSIAVERFEEGDTSAKPQLQRLVAAGSDVILLPSCGPSTITAAKEVIELGFTGKVLVENCFASVNTAKSVKDFANDQVHVMAPQFMLGIPGQGDPQRNAISDYLAKVRTPEITVAAGWDAAHLLAQAITKAGGPDPAKVRSTLEDGFRFTGVWSAGTMTAADHRGAATKGALIPSYFTKDGRIAAVDGGPS